MAGSRSPFVFPEFADLQLPLYVGEKLFDRQSLQILRVEPFELGTIENTVGAAHASQREFFEQLAGAQEFLIAARRPADTREKFAECLAKKTFAAVHVDVGSAVALGKARLVRAKNQRQMRENGNPPTQRAIGQPLFGRAGI